MMPSQAPNASPSQAPRLRGSNFNPSPAPKSPLFIRVKTPTPTPLPSQVSPLWGSKVGVVPNPDVRESPGDVHYSAEQLDVLALLCTAVKVLLHTS